MCCPRTLKLYFHVYLMFITLWLQEAKIIAQLLIICPKNSTPPQKKNTNNIFFLYIDLWTTMYVGFHHQKNKMVIVLVGWTSQQNQPGGRNHFLSMYILHIYYLERLKTDRNDRKYFALRPCQSQLTLRQVQEYIHTYPLLERRSTFLLLVTLRGPPLYSETGWTGELWSNCVLLILEN